MENVLSIIVKKPWLSRMLEEIEWLNVQVAEVISLGPGRHGRWLDAQTDQEKECS